MIDFPNAPTVGDAFVAAGTTYQCTQVSPNVWLGSPASGLGIPDAPNDGVQYGRQSKAWTPIASPVGTYVLKTGDTMTGALVINQTASPYNATITLNKLADANSSTIYGQAGGLSRWTLMLGSGGASDFILQPYADNGVTPNPTPLKIIRATSSVQIGDGTVAAPGLAFISESGLGWFRQQASILAVAAQGGVLGYIGGPTPTITSMSLTPRAAGASYLYLSNQPNGAANANVLVASAEATQYTLHEQLSGTATAKLLAMNFPAGIVQTAGSFIVTKGNIGMGDGTVPVSLYINGPAANGKDILSQANASNRWYLRLGEGGTNDDFVLWSYGNDGTTLTQQMRVTRIAPIQTQFYNPTIVNGLMTLAFSGAGPSLAIQNGDGGGVFMQMNHIGYGNRTIRNYQLTVDMLNAASTLSTHQFANDGNASKAAGGTTWGVSCDVRAKTDIEDWDGGLDKVLSLRPRKFTRTDTGERSIGCVADEAEVGFGELITRSPGLIGGVEYGDRAMLHIDPLFWALVNAVKTLNAKIEALQ